MKQNITGAVSQCHACLHYFTLGLEGEGDTCDQCADTTESPEIDQLTELDDLRIDAAS